MKGSKQKDITPGTKYEVLEEKCPNCNTNLKKLPGCCGAKNGLLKCTGCGYQVNL